MSSNETWSASVNESGDNPVENKQDEENEPTKATYRKKVWEYFENNSISCFPRPVFGRIPNFKESEEAAAKLLDLIEFQNCKTVEVNPDKPQEAARILALQNDKILYVPVPRLKEGLLKLITASNATNKTEFKQIASRKGINWGGTAIGLSDDIRIDLLVVGSVAVSKEGHRIGKGRGYADLEFAVLREMKAVNDSTVIVTNVHDSQVFDTFPHHLFQSYDVPVDIIITPSQVIRVEERLKKPTGIIWNLLSQRRLNLMPILQILRKTLEKDGKDVNLKEVDSDVETPRPQRILPRRRRNESGGEGGDGRVAQRSLRFYRKKQPKVDPLVDTNNLNHVEEKKERPLKSFRRNKFLIEFSLVVNNFDKTVRVRDMKNVLIERGIKPSAITWRGHKGFCILHYAKLNAKENVENQSHMDSVIEMLKNTKINPNSETNLNVEVLDPVSRMETVDVTAV